MLTDWHGQHLCQGTNAPMPAAGATSAVHALLLPQPTDVGTTDLKTTEASMSSPYRSSAVCFIGSTWYAVPSLNDTDGWNSCMLCCGTGATSGTGAPAQTFPASPTRASRALRARPHLHVPVWAGAILRRAFSSTATRVEWCALLQADAYVEATPLNSGTGQSCGAVEEDPRWRDAGSWDVLLHLSPHAAHEATTAPCCQQSKEEDTPCGGGWRLLRVIAHK